MVKKKPRLSEDKAQQSGSMAIPKTAEALEGVRAQRLREAMTRALESTLKNCTYKKLAECFPTIASDYKEALVSAHTQVLEFVRASVLEEYQIILQDRDLVNKLNALDEIIAEANTREAKNIISKSAYTPGLTPISVTRARSNPIKMEELARLKASLLEVDKINNGLKESIKMMTNQCTDMETNLKSSMDDLRNGIDVASQGIKVNEINALMEDVVTVLPAPR